MRGAALAIAATLAMAVLGTGCGRKPLSAGELRAQAGAVCLAERLRARQVPKPLAPADVPAFLAAALDVVKPAVDKLGALRAPDNLRSRFDAAVAVLRRRLGLLQDAAGRLRAHGEPLATFAALGPKLRALKREEARHWLAAGLPQCAG